jgi:putative two-component system response regulator
LTTKRVYKPAFSHATALDIIREGRGRHFDPDIVDAFEANLDRFVTIHEQLAHREDEEVEAIARRMGELAPV